MKDDCGGGLDCHNGSSPDKLWGINTNMCVFLESVFFFFLFLNWISQWQSAVNPAGRTEGFGWRGTFGGKTNTGARRLFCKSSARRANVGLKSCWTVSSFTQCNTRRCGFPGELSDKICLSLHTVSQRHYFLIWFLLGSPDNVWGISFCSHLKAPTLTFQVWGRFWLPHSKVKTNWLAG